MVQSSAKDLFQFILTGLTVFLETRILNNASTRKMAIAIIVEMCQYCVANAEN
ncbi:hypothetical protein DPMN_073605 [Dreissena polymorpha]|uniref:Uncharacterized protein n=1 Tax=Dreissena polymorpha TaxID=45954 RepID=A0A9D4HBB6_DREPO|nr:hypothetical protein DPMN_073605 [Dreissena polymorpha]